MPLILPHFFTPERIADFWSRVDRSGEHWLWVGPVNPDGYGKTSGYSGGAHRVAWFLATGDDPGSKHVLHTCDIPRCVRNDEIGVYSVVGIEYPRRGHLFLGDAAANAKDRTQKYWADYIPDNFKDRNKKYWAGSAIVNAEIAVEIRDLYHAGVWGKFQLAERFDVSVSVINDAINYRL